MGLISVADLDARRVEYEDEAQALAAIDDASAVARAYVSPIFDDIDRDGDPDVPDAVVAVVVGMVRRVLTNPRGLASETLGDYTYAAGSNAVATLLPTQREKKVLRQAAKAFAKAQGLDVPAFGTGSPFMGGDLPVPPGSEGFTL